MASPQEPVCRLLRKLVNLQTYRERDLFYREHLQELLGLRDDGRSAEDRILTEAVAMLRHRDNDAMFWAAHALNGLGYPEGEKILVGLRLIEDAVDTVGKRLADLAEDAGDAQEEAQSDE